MISKQQIDFYRQNGYLVLKNCLEAVKLEELKHNYAKLRERLANKSGLLQGDYDREISQIRDLWKFDKAFAQFLLKEELGDIACSFFENGSARLLHDHIIHKGRTNNGVVPWHQDYTYWPVDNPGGLSLWMPFMDLDENAGVLEVIPGSHLNGEERPVDFMNDCREFDDENIVSLPVNKGDLVILHSLTWHRTNENQSVSNRIAYISLWIPSDSKYAPTHADWHPVNDNITVQEGEELNEDWFPVVGSYQSTRLKNKFSDNSRRSNGSITMFNASRIAKRFLIKHLDFNEPDSLWQYLYQDDHRKEAVSLLGKRFSLDNSVEIELDSALKSMAINGIAYAHHRARNVYNDSYLTFRKFFNHAL